MLFKTQFRNHHLIRKPCRSFRTVMVSVTFYDSSINVLDNLWQKHLKRNQIMENDSFLQKGISEVV